MKVKIILSIVLVSFLLISLKAQNRYGCFQNDKNQNLKISVCFDKNDKALYVKYKGYEETMPIFYSKKEVTPNTGGHPSLYVSITYIEKYREKVTGKYVFSNTGIGGLDVTYYRAKDNKEFYFTMIPGTARYQDEACF